MLPTFSSWNSNSLMRRLLTVSNIYDKLLEQTYCRFPVDDDVFSKWLKVIGKYTEKVVFKNTMFICSDHFKPEDFTIVAGKRFLKKGVIPSLHLHTEVGSDKIEVVPSTSKSLEELDIFIEVPALPLKSKTPSFATPFTKKSTPKKRRLSVSTDDTGSESSPKSVKVRAETISSGSDSSASRKRRHFKIEHSYAVSPRNVAKKAEETKRKFIQGRRKLYKATESIRRLRRKVDSLTTVLKDLKSKHTLSSFALDHLEKSFGNVPHILMSRMLKNVRSGSVSTNQYPEELRKFAITLHFYSCKAYDYVRRTFNLALPHPSTIRKWSCNVECLPGFSTLCFEALKIKVAEAEKLNKKVICNLVFDEMSIKKQVDFDGTSYWGYVDIGIDFKDDEVEPAQEALVVMVVSLNSSWKLPIGYFLIKSLTAAEKANVICEALTRLNEIKVEISSVTCDGPTTHFSMFQQLGCNFKNINNLRVDFIHPALGNNKVMAIFDACHMIKLIRNALADLQIVIDADGNAIKWEYISMLYNIQEKETLSLANKLSKSHMEWRKQKMKVNVACQTLSNSVAEALLFLKNDLSHPQFQGCEATVTFIKTVDKIFDLMNSRLPWVKGFKGPLRLDNEHEWRPFVHSATTYLLNLKDIKGKFLWQTPRKTPFLGFAISLTSILQIFDSFVKTRKMSYLLTYKLSQDHLELFFCSIRARNGWNNNPSALQFMRSYKKLLLHTDVAGGSGNCKVLDTTSILSVTSGNSSKKESLVQQVDPYEVRKTNKYYEDYISSLQDHNYDILPKLLDLTDFSENVVTYIAGYVIKMLKRTIHCTDCLELLLEEDPSDRNYLLIKRRNLGAYVYPSRSLVTICYETEVFIRRLMHLTDNSLPSPDLVHDIILNVSAKLLPNLGHNIYSNHEHNFYLLKVTINCYCKIRLNNLAKKYTAVLQGDLIRKKFNKLILFHHQ